MKTPASTEFRGAQFPTYARKRFGQHFLVDTEVVGEIVRYLALQPTDRVVEIGPGRGALTQHLVASGAHIDAIEIDRDLATGLHSSFATFDQMTIHTADALKFDFVGLAERGGKLRIVGNLPYNISTPLLIQLLQASGCIVDICVMVQQEVADRLTAQPRTADYGRLSVMTQAFMDVDQVLQVPPSAFEPPPKVNSCVVALRPRPRREIEVQFSVLSGLVATAFSMRRKMIRHTLGKILASDVLEAHAIKVTQRAEELTVAQYVALASIVSDSTV